jgi:hypothetical protein
MPHVTVRRIDGPAFAYADIWQHRNLLLVALPPRDEHDAGASSEHGAGASSEHDVRAYAASLSARTEAWRAYDATVVLTRDGVPGLPAPAVVIADRWGEIVGVEAADTVAGLPAAADLVEWLRFVAHACPECEGEVK